MVKKEIKKNLKLKDAYILRTDDNVEVTQKYIDAIKTVLGKFGYACQQVTSLDGVPKKALIVFVTSIEAFIFYQKGYRNMLLWQQGATGEESYIRHKSKIRRKILNYMDSFIMKKAKFIFFVSEYMRDYYEKMAHTSFKKKSYVMPCFNESLDKEMIAKKDYSKKTFGYVGSLDLWQCFEETVELYSQIEKRFPDAFFKVLTFDTEKGERILKEKGIKNYSVACVPKDQVKKELEEVTYGFVIRKDIDVNRVATPTKLSSYLSAGVLPIYSSCLKDFHRISDGKSYSFAMEIGEDVSKLLEYIEINKNKETLMQQIEDLFNTYYSEKKHIEKITTLVEDLL